jgi:hypothetical protein
MSQDAQGVRRHALELIERALGKQGKAVLVCPFTLLQFLNGDHKMTLLLNQILYWTDRTTDPDGWFYKSYADWYSETGLSEWEVRRIVHGDPRTKTPQPTLKDYGLETKIKKAPNGSPTCYYRLDQSIFFALLVEFLQQRGLTFEPAQCAETSPDNAQNGNCASPGMETELCSASSSSTETTSEISDQEITSSSMPTHHPDEIEKYKRFEGKFGRLKDTITAELCTEVARLGADRVGEVVQRCTKRGRSWAYVLAALANETEQPVPERVPDSAARVSPMLEDDDEPERPAATERIAQMCVEQHGWTAEESWQAVYHQLEMQLDRASFDTFLRGAQLMDYDREQNAFTVLVRTSYAREMCQNRLIRLITRVLKDVCGRPMEARFVTAEEWLGQGRVEAVA